MQTEEGYSDDAVQTYLQVLSLQEDEDPDEVADAHVQASDMKKTLLLHTHLQDLVENIWHALSQGKR